jgi:hypothetical protein
MNNCALLDLKTVVIEIPLHICRRPALPQSREDHLIVELKISDQQKRWSLCPSGTTLIPSTLPGVADVVIGERRPAGFF